MSRAIVIQNLAPESSGTQYAVCTHGQAWEGRFKRNVLFIDLWCETEDEARAYAHRMEHP